MLTTTGHRLPGAPGRLVTETAAWGALIALVAISYIVAGTSGFFATVGGRAFTATAESLGAGGFDNQQGSLSLLIVFVLSCTGLFIPSKVFATKAPAVRKTALSVAAVVEAALLIVLSLAPSAWLTWVAALFLGGVVGLLMSINPFTNEKPWRRVGIPATVLVFLSCVFQILGGAAAGTRALGWVSLLVGIGMAVGAVIVFLTPERALHAETATTGSFPSLKARVARPAASIANPWVCIALFAVLGATFLLSQPTAVEHNFGQAGYALIIACCLIGWAIGFEMGPTFAPGMSRPRVSTFALLVSGVLLIATGAINELSGKVVLSAAIAFLVGIGVRSQPYDFSRRIGAVAGAGLALIINALDFGGVVDVGSTTDWLLAPSDVAFIIIGVAALIAGIIGLFVFDPHKLQGLAVDIVHGFRPPSTAESSAGGLGTSAERLGAGFFIAIEGGDGSGKSTQIKRISRALADEGHNVEATREPGGTELGRQIRSVIFDSEKPSARTEALLFAADRAHHVTSLVDPSLDAGNIVITDRYIDSTVAYQAAGRNFDPKTILALSQWATQGLVPHLTIVLDIDPEVAAERMGRRGESNYLDEENQQFHQRVRQTYLTRAHKEPDRYVVLDASVSPDELTREILSAIHARLPVELGTRPGAVAGAAGVGPAAVAGTPTPSATQSADHTSTDTEAAPTTAAESASGPASDDSAEKAVEFESDAANGSEEASVAGAAHDSVSEEPGSSAADEDDDMASEPRARFVPVSNDRFRPGAVTDEEVADSEHFPTERVDLGADLREPERDDVPAFLAGDSAADSADSDESSDDAEEAATTVLPAHRFTPSAPATEDEDDDDSVPTNVIETRAAEEAETRVVKQADHGSDDDAETTVLPARSARAMSRERLQAQAEIERQARERLRRQRERSNRRFTNPEDS